MILDLTPFSKAQYEHRFRLWGFRKNIKRKDMDFIVDAKCKYARLGKDVLVELNGKSVDQRRIERETVRRGIIERSASPDIGSYWLKHMKPHIDSK